MIQNFISRLFFCVFLLLVFGSQSTNAQQQQTPKKNRSGFLFPITYKFQLPAGDLADRFGSNSSVAGGIYYKSTNNWLIGIEGSLLFGSKIKDTSILDSYVFTSDGDILDSSGIPTDIFFFERGFELSARLGRLIPISKKNQESGLLVQVGAGFLQHKYVIDNKDFAVPYLIGDYLKGIDKLTNGFAISQHIGYLHLDKKKWTNVSLGFEIIEAFTKNRRSYNFDEMKADTKTRVDIFIGIRLSVILAVYDKKDDFFYK